MSIYDIYAAPGILPNLAAQNPRTPVPLPRYDLATLSVCELVCVDPPGTDADIAPETHCVTSISIVGKTWFQNISQLIAVESVFVRPSETHTF